MTGVSCDTRLAGVTVEGENGHPGRLPLAADCSQHAGSELMLNSLCYIIESCLEARDAEAISNRLSWPQAGCCVVGRGF